MTTEIQTKETTAIVKKTFGKYKGAGREEMTKDDYTLPFLQLLQDLSPSVQSRQNKAGEIFHSATKEVFSGEEGITFIPVYVSREFIEWVPRKRGGGLVGRHRPSSEVVFKAKQRQIELSHAWNEIYAGDSDNPNTRNELVETGSIYGLVIREDGSTTRVVIPCKATHLSAYKNFNSMCGDLPGDPPLFALRIILRTVKESRTAGDSYNWGMSFDGNTPNEYIMNEDDELFMKGAQFYESIKEGSVKFDHAKTSESSNPEEDSESPF